MEKVLKLCFWSFTPYFLGFSSTESSATIATFLPQEFASVACSRELSSEDYLDTFDLCREWGEG